MSPKRAIETQPLQRVAPLRCLRFDSPPTAARTRGLGLCAVRFVSPDRVPDSPMSTFCPLSPLLVGSCQAKIQKGLVLLLFIRFKNLFCCMMEVPHASGTVYYFGFFGRAFCPLPKSGKNGARFKTDASNHQKMSGSPRRCPSCRVWGQPSIWLRLLCFLNTFKSPQKCPNPFLTPDFFMLFFEEDCSCFATFGTVPRARDPASRSDPPYPSTATPPRRRPFQGVSPPSTLFTPPPLGQNGGGGPPGPLPLTGWGPPFPIGLRLPTHQPHPPGLRLDPSPPVCSTSRLHPAAIQAPKSYTNSTKIFKWFY